MTFPEQAALDVPAVPPDQRLLAGGHVRAVRPGRSAALTARLRDAGYHVVTVDAGEWTTVRAMHGSLAAALCFPAWYGHDADALADCLGDVAAYCYGADPADAGLVLVVAGFDGFLHAHRRAAAEFADVFTGAARYGMLLGHRMLCLLQVPEDGPPLPELGSTRVTFAEED